MAVEQQYPQVLEEVRRQCQLVGRQPDEVTLIAVSKTVEAPVVGRALSVGAHDFGENRPDLLIQKAAAYPQATWHFIGNIQSRRIPDIVKSASLIHSLFEERHALKIDQAAAQLGKVQDVLLEVNVSGEESKSGLEPAAAASLLGACLQLEHVRVRGLMTMAPQGDRQVALACFQQLARLRQDLAASLPPSQQATFNELSMGMSEDWREAIAAGATMVRIGRAIFSEDFAR